MVSPSRRVLGIAAVLAASVTMSGCSVIGGLLGGGNNVFTLKVGDCFNEGTLVNDEVADVPIVECSEPHLYEVTKSVILEDGDYPGEDEVVGQAEDECFVAFEDYIGASWEQSGSLDYSYFVPTTETWNDADDREILCLVVDLEGERKGSVKNAGPQS
ncbi:septum formation family protein [Cryobacterium sp. BB307]|uniref:septum formation family protein n=1 Tax=Cryobacterium sp. BB307 TaxID=2716317 RepID=UPI001447A129|nr:septum formation family protein [Cryobacterium sp. BB307]